MFIARSKACSLVKERAAPTSKWSSNSSKPSAEHRMLCRRERQCDSPFSMSSGGCSQEIEDYLGFRVCCRQDAAMLAALQRVASPPARG